MPQLNSGQKAVLRFYGKVLARCATGHHQASERAKARCRDWAIDQAMVLAVRKLRLPAADINAIGETAARYGWLHYRKAYFDATGICQEHRD